MTPEEYVKAELDAGRLTAHHIVTLTQQFQAAAGLETDGRPGPVTRAKIEAAWPHPPISTPFLSCPLPKLDDGRIAVVTSEYRPPDRPNHNGIDWFYHWKEGDKPDFVGDHGAAGKTADGKPKWVVPLGENALAAAAGTVQLAGNSATGYRIWIDHHNGWRTGYFHLLSLLVHQGDTVAVGTPLGPVGDNPADFDGRHLHFELSPVEKYSPVDPTPFLIK